MKTVIEMALEADALPYLASSGPRHLECLTRFATLVKAAHTAELLEGVELPEAHQLFTERCGHFVVTAEQLRPTVAAAVLREREACAKVCESEAEKWKKKDLLGYVAVLVDDAATAIRARSKA